MDNFVREDDAIQDFSNFYITRLFRGNEKREKRIDAVSNYFGDDFVDNIVEGDGSELTGEGGSRFFRHQSEVGGVESQKEPLFMKQIFYHFM